MNLQYYVFNLYLYLLYYFILYVFFAPARCLMCLGRYASNHIATSSVPFTIVTERP